MQKKKWNILYIILVQDFCQLKIKIAQFAGGFRVIWIQEYRIF